jgi:hypothetical protein
MSSPRIANLAIIEAELPGEAASFHEMSRSCARDLALWL